MANGQAFFPFFAAFTIWISRYKYKGSAGTNRRGQQVQIQRSAGTNTRVSRYKYKGQPVQIQESAGTNTRVSRYKYNGYKMYLNFQIFCILFSHFMLKLEEAFRNQAIFKISFLLVQISDFFALFG